MVGEFKYGVTDDPYLQVTWRSQVLTKNRLKKALEMAMVTCKLPLFVKM